jgi:hypothetical protein
MARDRGEAVCDAAAFCANSAGGRGVGGESGDSEPSGHCAKLSPASGGAREERNAGGLGAGAGPSESTRREDRYRDWRSRAYSRSATMAKCA